MTNVSFCSPESQWPDFISDTQSPLFSADFLLDCGNSFRNQFYENSGRNEFQAKLEVCNFPGATEVLSVRSGYDLPILLTSDNFTGKYVVLMAQDPLRSTGEGLIVGTPWGFHLEQFRTKRHYRMLWEIVIEICSHGFGVWITDASKLYVCKKEKPLGLSEVEHNVLRTEIENLRPSHIIAMGKSAVSACKAMGFPHQKLAHPTARASHLRSFYSIEDAKLATIKSAILARILPQLGVPEL